MQAMHHRTKCNPQALQPIFSLDTAIQLFRPQQSQSQSQSLLEYIPVAQQGAQGAGRHTALL
jgi:hypothetical protein